MARNLGTGGQFYNSYLEFNDKDGGAVMKYTDLTIANEGLFDKPKYKRFYIVTSSEKTERGLRQTQVVHACISADIAVNFYLFLCGKIKDKVLYFDRGEYRWNKNIYLYLYSFDGISEIHAGNEYQSNGDERFYDYSVIKPNSIKNLKLEKKFDGIEQLLKTYNYKFILPETPKVTEISKELKLITKTFKSEVSKDKIISPYVKIEIDTSVKEDFETGEEEFISIATGDFIDRYRGVKDFSWTDEIVDELNNMANRLCSIIDRVNVNNKNGKLRIDSDWDKYEFYITVTYK